MSDDAKKQKVSPSPPPPPPEEDDPGRIVKDYKDKDDPKKVKCD